MSVWLAVKQNPGNAKRQISVHLSEESILPSRGRGWWEPQLFNSQQVSRQTGRAPVWLLFTAITPESPSSFSCPDLARKQFSPPSLHFLSSHAFSLGADLQAKPFPSPLLPQSFSSKFLPPSLCSKQATLFWHHHHLSLRNAAHSQICWS